MKEKELLTIGNFSEYTKLNRSTLIYYDESGLFSPVERRSNGYRYYAPEQISTVNLVTYLQQFGIPLKKISEIMQCKSPEKTIKLLQEQKNSLLDKIEQTKYLFKVLNEFLIGMQEGLAADENRISVQHVEQRAIKLGLVNDFSKHQPFLEPFRKFCDENDGSVLYPIGGYFDSMSDFLKHPSEPDRFFAMDPDGPHIMSEGYYLVGYTRGYYSQTNDLPQRIEKYALENNIVFDAPVYNVFLLNELSGVDFDKYLLQVSARIKTPEA
ncbi:MAG: MerR family transcriptional regulator [Clostridiales bacterium]|jgi:DNA-binding transcriptional MerR regulator|nr:MerR family transcriptional regulator [Clostridiales bacterium]